MRASNQFGHQLASVHERPNLGHNPMQPIDRRDQPGDVRIKRFVPRPLLRVARAVPYSSYGYCNRPD